jgi:ectoine hydroxylase-related dioxygenase (phytanoyl-CoA dioxygenase family)
MTERSYWHPSVAASYVLDFRVRSSDLADSRRSVNVLAAPEEIERFARDGYLVREGTFQGPDVEEMRAALDEVVESEPDDSPTDVTSTSRRYGGRYVSQLMEKHRTFLELVRCQPIVSVVRAVLGPQVQIRGVSARITYPDEPNQETHWHFHQRLVPEPLPPFFSLPQTLEALIYLDDVGEANGPLCVVPGSHRWIERELPREDYEDKPGQQLLPLPAGSCVMVHGSLWHRALPTRPDGTVRRLLIVGFGPAWMRSWSKQDRRTSPLIEELLADADQETRELLGITGPM